jgi:ABC-type dipeptide/oligopeptide/nickel transport system permease component
MQSGGGFTSANFGNSKMGNFIGGANVVGSIIDGIEGIRAEKHALRAALLPIVTVLGLQLGSLLAGTVITETVFAWDGIGRLLVESIEKRDYPVTQACVLVIALTYVFVNLLTDIIYTRIDPRVRFSS